MSGTLKNWNEYFVKPSCNCGRNKTFKEDKKGKRDIKNLTYQWLNVPAVDLIYGIGDSDALVRNVLTSPDFLTVDFPNGVGNSSAVLSNYLRHNFIHVKSFNYEILPQAFKNDPLFASATITINSGSGGSFITLVNADSVPLLSAPVPWAGDTVSMAAAIVANIVANYGSFTPDFTASSVGNVVTITAPAAGTFWNGADFFVTTSGIISISLTGFSGGFDGTPVDPEQQFVLQRAEAFYIANANIFGSACKVQLLPEAYARNTQFYAELLRVTDQPFFLTANTLLFFALKGFSIINLTLDIDFTGCYCQLEPIEGDTANVNLV